MHDEHAEEVRPGGFEVAFGSWLIPNLMLVALFVGNPAQLVWRSLEEEVLPEGDFEEDGEFLSVIGITALKARNCFTAASELCNKCLERDSRRSAAWFMGRH
jgi:hypothetical protein